MAIIVVTGSTGGSRRDASISSLTGGDGPTSGGGEDQQEKDSGCDPSDLWMLSPSAASVLCGHLPITASHSGSHSRHSSSHLHHHQVREIPHCFFFYRLTVKLNDRGRSSSRQQPPGFKKTKFKIIRRQI
jgi:hypothetical protein